MNRKTHNDAYSGSQNANRVSVKLACGCTLKTRNSPMNVKTTYPCRSGMGHGYSVGWVSWTEGNRGGVNDG